MSGRVSYGMPAPVWAARRFRCRRSIAVFAAVASLLTTCSARTAARDNHSPASARVRCCTPRDRRRSSSSPEPPNSMRRSFCRRTAICWVAPIRIQTSFPEIDLSRFDPETKVSRRHARIWLEGETFLVEDLGSVNGTVINDSVRLAPRQPRVLDSGDKLRVGETTLHFLVGRNRLIFVSWPNY
jgi:hypothetical protein